jgi:hypothetical protein
MRRRRSPGLLPLHVRLRCRDEGLRMAAGPGGAGRRPGFWHTRAELGFRIYLWIWIMLRILGTYWI